MRFWLEEYAFGEGETVILREQIQVHHFQEGVLLLFKSVSGNEEHKHDTTYAGV